MGFPIEYSDPELVEYLALDRAKYRQEDRLISASKKAFDAKYYSKAVSRYHQAVMLLLELKVLVENVDDSTSWDSVSMREKALKIMDIVNVLDHFQRKVRKLAEQNEISDAGSRHSSVGSNEVKEIVQNI